MTWEPVSGVLLFAGSTYYPDGGWSDYIGCFPTRADAKAEWDRRYAEDAPHHNEYNWAQLVVGGQLVEEVEPWGDGEWKPFEA